MTRSFLSTALAAVAVVAAASAASAGSVNVYAIPSGEIRDTVIAVSGKLAELGMEAFARTGHEIHATLYLTDYSDEALPDLKATVETIAAGWSAFPLTTRGIEVTPSNWVFVGIDKTDALQRLSDQVVLAASPLRDTSVAAPAWMKNFPDKLPTFERYGSPNVFAEFSPHFTLLAGEESPKLGAFVEWAEEAKPTATGSVVGIGIGRADANGQISEILAEYRFGGTN
jgi:2'-5' RNA ligase